MGQLARYEWDKAGETSGARGMEDPANGQAVFPPFSRAFGRRRGSGEANLPTLQSAEVTGQKHSSQAHLCLMEKTPIPGSFYKRGTFWWYKRTINGKTMRVSTKMVDRDSAIAWVQKGAFGTRTFTQPKDIPDRFVTRLLQQAKGRARAIGVVFRLSKDDFHDLYGQANKHCAVSGLPFDLSQLNGINRRPYAPSIDRIDGMLGYTKGNCRIVCCAVNLAMNDFGEDVLWDIAASMVELRRRKLNAARNLANLGTMGA
jgi:hypothetical protein